MSLTTEQVWDAIGDAIFGVVGFVTAMGEARTAGIVYAVDGRSLVFPSDADAWKVRHISGNPHVSMTIPVAKRIPFLPFIKIPAATITFKGEAEILEVSEIDEPIMAKIFRGLDVDEDKLAGTRIVRIVPRGDFVTYGIAMPLMQMRDTEKARGRAPCGTEHEVLRHPV